jgi:hypothetical protein
MNLSNGVEPADRSQPTATNSLIARNRSHTRKRAQRHHISRGLDWRERPCQHLTLIPFLVPRTAPRCPLLGSDQAAQLAGITRHSGGIVTCVASRAQASRKREILNQQLRAGKEDLSSCTRVEVVIIRGL